MRISPLESFVRKYVQQHRGSTLQKVFLQKAVTLISEKLAPSCCTNPDATINYHTRSDNNFTNGVRMILNSNPVEGNKFSYTRTKTFLNNIINGTCCN